MCTRAHSAVGVACFIQTNCRKDAAVTILQRSGTRCRVRQLSGLHQLSDSTRRPEQVREARAQHPVSGPEFREHSCDLFLQNEFMEQDVP